MIQNYAVGKIIDSEQMALDRVRRCKQLAQLATLLSTLICFTIGHLLFFILVQVLKHKQPEACEHLTDTIRNLSAKIIGENGPVSR